MPSCLALSSWVPDAERRSARSWSIGEVVMNRSMPRAFYCRQEAQQIAVAVRNDLRDMSNRDQETVERIGANLRFLFEHTNLEIQEISTRSDVGMRTIQAMKSGRGNPNVSNVDAVARAFRLGLTGWHLLSKSLRDDFQNREFLERISQVYGATTDKGQEVLIKAMEIAEGLKRPEELAPADTPEPPPKGPPVADAFEDARTRVRNRPKLGSEAGAPDYTPGVRRVK